MTQVSPVRVQLNGDTSPLPYEPPTAIDATFLAVDDMVIVERIDSLYVIVGRATGFTVPDASSTVKGLTEFATDAETIAGTDSERAVTPAGLFAARGLPVQGQVPSSVVVGSGSASVAGDGTVTFDGCTWVDLRGVFDGAGADIYEVTVLSIKDGTTGASTYRLLAGGTPKTTGYDRAVMFKYSNDGSAVSATGGGTTNIGFLAPRSNPGTVAFGRLLLVQPNKSGPTWASVSSRQQGAASAVWEESNEASAGQFDGLQIQSTAGGSSGTIKVVKVA